MRWPRTPDGGRSSAREPHPVAVQEYALQSGRGPRIRAAGEPRGSVANRRPARRWPSGRTRRSSATPPALQPDRLYRMARSKAYLFRGVEIRWSCDPATPAPGAARSRPRRSCIFPAAWPTSWRPSSPSGRTMTQRPFAGRAEFPDGQGSVEWAVPPGRPTTTGSPRATATPCRRRRAAPTRRACAPA